VRGVFKPVWFRAHVVSAVMSSDLNLSMLWESASGAEIRLGSKSQREGNRLAATPRAVGSPSRGHLEQLVHMRRVTW
jgi:hypothetical protein